MPRHIGWQVLLIVLGVVLVGILLGYLAFNYTTVLRPGRGGTYVEGVVGVPRYVNPLLAASQVDQDVTALVFSGLTRLNERGEVEPDLALKWEKSYDGLIYTFYLRSDVRWHDGTVFSADDVVFTIGLLQSPDFSGPPELGAAIWRNVTVERLDRYRVRFTLNEPYPYAPFLDYTTVGILPAHLLEGVPAGSLPAIGFNLNPVGTGPFRMAEMEVEDDLLTAMVLEQSPFYYERHKPYLERIQFRFYPSSKEVLDAYENGEVEGIARIPTTDLARARAFSDLNLYSAQMAEYAIVLLNQRNPAPSWFRDVEMRQALLQALDRQKLIDEALEGQGLVAHSVMIPGTWAYHEDVLRYEHDPENAGATFEDARWHLDDDDGMRYKGGEPLGFALLTLGDPERMAVAHALARQWATVGISVTVETGSALEVREALETGDYQAALVHLALPGDPDPYPFWHETQIEDGQNYTALVHRQISELIEQARVKVNRERRRELYVEFQDLFAQEVPSLPLYVPVYTYGVDGRIQNVQIGPLADPSDRFRTVADWWIVPRRVFVSENE